MLTAAFSRNKSSFVGKKTAPLLTKRNNVEILRRGIRQWQENIDKYAEFDVHKQLGEVWSWITVMVLWGALLFSWKRIKDKEWLWVKGVDTERMNRDTGRNTVHVSGGKHPTICHMTMYDPFPCYHHTGILEISQAIIDRHKTSVKNQRPKTKAACINCSIPAFSYLALTFYFVLFADVVSKSVNN